MMTDTGTALLMAKRKTELAIQSKDSFEVMGDMMVILMQKLSSLNSNTEEPVGDLGRMVVQFKAASIWGWLITLLIKDICFLPIADAVHLRQAHLPAALHEPGDRAQRHQHRAQVGGPDPQAGAGSHLGRGQVPGGGCGRGLELGDALPEDLGFGLRQAGRLGQPAPLHAGSGDAGGRGRGRPERQEQQVRPPPPAPHGQQQAGISPGLPRARPQRVRQLEEALLLREGGGVPLCRLTHP